MFDIFNLPKDFRGDVQVFTAGMYQGDVSYTEWVKPRGCSMAHFFVMGGGAGGGGGFSAAAGNPRGGGAGGASSAVARLTIPLMFIPDTLFMQVAIAASGGAPGGTGSNAHQSSIRLMPNSANVVNYVLLCSGNGNAGANPGTAGGGGLGQAGQAAGTIGVNPIAGLGIYSFSPGQTGCNGGAHTGANGTSVTLPAGGTLAQAGAGGAGTQSADFAGGGHTGVSSGGLPSYISQHLPAAPVAGSVDGHQGLTLWKPFFGMGGAGGSSSNTGVGGNGGNGGIGGGGGGGGGGTTGGRGGNGGSGIIVVVCW